MNTRYRATTEDVSAVVCTMNSMTSIEPCLRSLKQAGVGEIIVVDANSADGTCQIANELADLVFTDSGTGLGNARNIGIKQTKGSLILNMGSDNVMPPNQLNLMIATLEHGDYYGVSAQTRIEGMNYPSIGLNAWREGRFRPGPAVVIGTPTLFRGDVLRANPYDPTRIFSDDSELCERWAAQFGATFAISNAEVLEIGKTTWREVLIRCQMYGISDEETFRMGRQGGWPFRRQLKSLVHPIQVDFLTPIINLPPVKASIAVPFLASFAALRYASWGKSAMRRHGKF